MMKVNRKGFTLVELLAVIVVLAIIMIIAMPNVITAMNNAKKSTFKIYAQKVLGAAQAQYQSDMLMNTTMSGYQITGTINGYSGGFCYTLPEMGLRTTGNYEGYVIIVENANREPFFYVYLSDNSWSFKGMLPESFDKPGAFSTPTKGTFSSCPKSSNWSAPTQPTA